MSDLAPLPKCRRRKSGSHDLSYFVPDTIDADITMVCDACGMVRRIPASGALSGSLDGMTAEQITMRIANIGVTKSWPE